MSELVTKIVSELRTTYPGIVEEWERQRADNPDWGFPGIETAHDLAWWVCSEVEMTEDFGRYDETGIEKQLGAYCLEVLQLLKEEPQ